MEAKKVEKETPYSIESIDTIIVRSKTGAEILVPPDSFLFRVLFLRGDTDNEKCWRERKRKKGA